MKRWVRRYGRLIESSRGRAASSMLSWGCPAGAAGRLACSGSRQGSWRQSSPTASSPAGRQRSGKSGHRPQGGAVGFRCCSIDSHKVVVDPRDRSTGDPPLTPHFFHRRQGPEGSSHQGQLDLPFFPGTGNTRYNPGKLYWLISLPPAKSTRPSHCQVNHLKTAPTIPRAKSSRDSPGPTG